MPGVPHEMYGLAEQVFARLAVKNNGIAKLAAPTFAGLGESSLQEFLPN